MGKKGSLGTWGVLGGRGFRKPSQHIEQKRNIFGMACVNLDSNMDFTMSDMLVPYRQVTGALGMGMC
eukprot:6376138-Amphidinium_carterae.1